ncbi:hypothetical protein FACS189432_07210 [Bacteroidia bacterium]|nr:hypothetical protein FACS189432_07210 [Bacteroidia bacterium]GHV71315.1 hypothetical protein FACS189420_5960 [Bacteroidia bacterium]
MTGQTVLLSTAYLAPIEYYRQMANHPPVIIEKYCNYTKQTYRNRCIIASANGLQTLSIPIIKPDSLKCLTKDIRIAEHGNWRRLHWNGIVSAYNSTPFFEYYADDFRPFYEKRPEFLFDFNEELRELICRLLDISPSLSYSSEYINQTNAGELDLREAIHPKKEAFAKDFKPYYQVFETKYGFQPNLSIIDLLFNMGPEAALFL